jgi:aspartate racemase
VCVTPAARDQDHIPTVTWSDGRVPDRTEALLGYGPSPLPALASGVRTLANAQVDVIAVPCNTAHFYLSSLRELTHVPFLNMVEETISTVARRFPSVERVGILCTRGTRLTRLYERACEARGLYVRHISLREQVQLTDEAVRRVKSGAPLDHAAGLVVAAIASLSRAGAQVAVTACTELSLIIEMADPVLPIVDSTTALAEAAVRTCY